MNVCIIATGSELLRGKINLNPSIIGRELIALGITVKRVVTIPDEIEILETEIKKSLDDFNLIIVIGGLGPTPDDITKDVLARIFKVGLTRDQTCLKKLQNRLQTAGREDRFTRFAVFCDVPEGFETWDNPIGLAPALAKEVDDTTTLIALPGPPHEVRAILRRHLIPYLQKKIGAKRQLTVLHVFGITEPDLIERFQQANLSLNGISIIPDYEGIHLYIPNKDTEFLSRVEEVLGPDLYGKDAETLELKIGKILRARGWKLSTAESLTGGLVGHLITRVFGSSAYYEGGIVSYSDTAKMHMLGVSRENLLEYGAVSEQVALEMAEGVRFKFSTETALSTTGIAGPTGGTPKKPVGLVYIGVVVPGFKKVYRRIFSGERNDIKFKSAFTALDYLRRALEAT